MPYKLQPADVQEKWLAYCRQCDTYTEQQRYRSELLDVPKPVIYTVEGFCLFAGITQTELEKYERNKNFKTVFKNIRFAVLCRKLHALVNGEGSTTGLVFDLKANYGMHALKAVKPQDWKITLNLDDLQKKAARENDKRAIPVAENSAASLPAEAVPERPAPPVEETPVQVVVERVMMPTGRYCVF